MTSAAGAGRELEVGSSKFSAVTPGSSDFL
jgi:hypothetical protein